MAGTANIINATVGNVALPGTTVQQLLSNPDNTNAASKAQFLIQTGGASSGDAEQIFSTTATNWDQGCDNSDSDSFVISAGNVLGTNNVLRISTAGQVTFPLLAGISFIPTLQFGGASTGITYAGQAGLYYQFGNLVFYRLNINITSKGTATGSASIAGIPVASGLSGNLNTCVAFFQNITLTANYTSVIVQNGTSNNSVSILQQGSGQAIVALDDTRFTNTSLVYVSGFFFTD